jgi:hypothetical protein
MYVYHYTQYALLAYERRAMNGAKLFPLPIHELAAHRVL